MNRRLRLSLAASADLDDIWVYVAQEGSEGAANRLVDAITERFPALLVMPGSGRKRDEVRRGLRSHPAGNYVIYYREMKGGIEIVRILHGTRDVPRAFDPSSARRLKPTR
jgi:toxin ParE1/3/4